MDERLKKNYDEFIRIKSHDTEYQIFHILNKVSINLNLNKNIRKNAAYYYKKIIKKEKKITNNISLIAFCIFFAAKEADNGKITMYNISNTIQNLGYKINLKLILRDSIMYKRHLISKEKEKVL